MLVRRWLATFASPQVSPGPHAGRHERGRHDLTQATLRGGTPGRIARQLLALMAVLVLLAGFVPPAAAAGPDADPTKLEPALQRALAANPSGTFRVIVTRPPAKDRDDRRRKAAQVEADIANGGGRITRRLGLVDGHAATLS